MTRKRRVYAALVGISFLGGGYLFAQKLTAEFPPPKSDGIQDDELSSVMRSFLDDGVKWKGFFNDGLFDSRIKSLMDGRSIQKDFERMSEAEAAIIHDMEQLSAQERGALTGVGLGPGEKTMIVSPKVRTTKDQVVVSLTVPADEVKSIKVNVGRHEIKVAYSNVVYRAKQGERGAYEKSELVESGEQIIPIPREADASTGRVSRAGANVTITFARNSVAKAPGSRIGA